MIESRVVGSSSLFVRLARAVVKLAALVLLVAFTSGCDFGSNLDEASGGGGGGSSGHYAGTWIGQFNMKWTDNNVAKSAGFNITIVLKLLSPAVDGLEILTVTRAQVNHPYFGAMTVVTPVNPSLATLPYPAQNSSKQGGPGVLITFPNGTFLGTWNAAGALHQSLNGGSMSNSLGSDPGWITGGGFEKAVGATGKLTTTWNFTKSAL